VLSLKTVTVNSLATACAECLNRNLSVKKENTDYLKMVYGLESIFHNVPKLILMIIFSALLGILPQTFITLLPFALIRRYAAGVHAKNSISCALMSLIMFVAVPFLAKGIYVNAAIMFLSLAFVAFIMYRYAPADTEARPILGNMKRKKLKRKAIIACAFLPVLALILHETFYVLIVTGAIYAAIAVLPVTYNFLGRSINNYEQYE
jgi:accessory gene regulator B